MDFSLSNSLVGNAVFSGDKLALDLQFADDKTLIPRKGPTPAFARASGATFVDSDGLVKYAPENRVLQSENFSTPWSNSTGVGITFDAAFSPINDLTADQIGFIATTTAGFNRTLSQSLSTGLAGAPAVTASVWLRTISGTATVYISLTDGPTVPTRANTACVVTTEWQRFSVTLNNPLYTLTFLIGPDTRTTAGSPAQPFPQAAASVYAWGAQVERSSAARTYNPTTTAAFYGPRFDHNPVTGICKGLLLEELRTNFCLQSENFGTTWVPSNSTVALNVAVSPDGLTTADEIINGNGLTLGRVQQSFTLTGSHVYSVFAKVDGWNWVYIAPLQATGGVWFNLVNGTVGTQQAGFVGSITSYGNGWYRCAVQFTGLGTLLTSRIHPTNQDNVLTVGDGTSGVYLWGAQMEVGAFPTSYIPTTTGTVARSADVCNITGTAFSGFYSNTQGTLVTNAASLGAGSAQNPVVSIDNGTTQVMRLRHLNVTNRLGAVVSTVALTPSSGYDVANTFYKAALSAGPTGADFVINGTQIPDTYTGSVLTADNMKLTVSATGSTNTCVASIRYYIKQFPVSKLQELTV